MTFKYEGFNNKNEEQRKKFKDKLENWVVDLNEKSGPTL